MSDERDLNAQRTRMMENGIGMGSQTFNSFVPEEQPFTDKWEPEVPGWGTIKDDSLFGQSQRIPTSNCFPIIVFR